MKKSSDETGKSEELVVADTSKVKQEETKQELIIQEPIKVNLDSFANAVNLRWTAKARLERYVQVNKVLSMSMEEWQKLLKRI